MSIFTDHKVTRRALLLSTCGLVPGIRLFNALDTLAAPRRDYPVKPVPLTEVDILDDFWAPRMDVNRNVSIWHCFKKMKESEDFGSPKLIEGAAYMLAKRPDPRLEQYVDQVIDQLVSQLPARLADPDKAVRVSGHFLEAAAAYYAATGKRKMLDAALEDGKVIDANFGPGKRDYISEHEGQKIGLLQLYRQTGDDKYLKLAKFLMDGRGKDGYPRAGEYAIDRTYAQDHEPVVEQDEAVGHCVRATFLYIPLTDLAALTGRPGYKEAADKIWADVVHHKLYLTGGIGSIRFHEQFGSAYELPNLSAWNETCASYGNIVWNQRMFQLHQDAKYIDVLERVLYNGFADGVSLKGDRFFYQNPLRSFGSYERFEWIDVPCCPPNVVRLMASLGSYIYAQSSDSVYVNLFVGSNAKVSLPGGNTVGIQQETRYPWEGAVSIHLNPERAEPFTMLVRIPGWARNEVLSGDLYQYADKNEEKPTLNVNGRPVELRMERGYARLERKWLKGDTVQLHLPMPVRQVKANAKVQEDRDMVALQRGPLVYCAEWPDNGGHALNLIIPENVKFESQWRPELLNGIQVVTGNIKALQREDNSRELNGHRHQLVAIPYLAWSNRGPGEMAVWMSREPQKAWVAPLPPDPIHAVRSSGGVQKVWTGYNDQNDDIRALYDGKDPLSSADESYLYFRMRPEPGTAAWIEYEFKSPAKVSSTEVYWFDDRRFCRVPTSWRVLYKDGDAWKPVANVEPYVVAKDKFNAVSFLPVTTVAMRLEVEPATKLYKAGQIGPPAAMFIDKDTQWREFGLLEWRIS
ncbi:MAG TPA: beta-L-arabinofuranosidase domain-containing protein [Terriglobales bacterium]|nr:beta-L-arabinofuranosidase domain-containing protein [Terriglobales bacterium]